MKRRVKFAKRLFERSRTARTLFVIMVWPPLHLAERIRGAVEGWRDVSATSWRAGLDWARSGDADHLPTIPTSESPAVIGRRGVGRCGATTGATIWTKPPHPVCALHAGHPGWHRADDGCEWGIPRVSQP